MAQYSTQWKRHSCCCAEAFTQWIFQFHISPIVLHPERRCFTSASLHFISWRRWNHDGNRFCSKALTTSAGVGNLWVNVHAFVNHSISPVVQNPIQVCGCESTKLIVTNFIGNYSVITIIE